MGNTCTKIEGHKTRNKKDEALSEALAEDQQRDEALIKVLFIGAGESGKSTVFKQMINLYGKGFSGAELFEYTALVHTNLLDSLINLCDHLQELEEQPFAADQAATVYDFSPSEARDWLLSTIIAAFRHAKYPDIDFDAKLTHKFAALEQMEKFGLGELEEPPATIDDELGFLLPVLGEPAAENVVRAAVWAYVGSFAAEPDAAAQTVLDSFDLAAVIPPAAREAAARESAAARAEYVTQVQGRTIAEQFAELKADFEQLEALGCDVAVRAAEAALIRRIWASPGCRTAFFLRATSKEVQDNVRYYVARSGAVLDRQDWFTSFQDVARSRARTSGLQMREIVMQANRLQLIDVGGQRSERRKWLHAFVDVTSIIFVASAVGYDQVLFEDNTTNRLDEALELFEQICSTRYLETIPFVLFINKIDLFKQKVRTNPIAGEKFDEFLEKGEIPAEELADPERRESVSMDYLEWLFRERCKGARQLFVHFTTATDTSNIVKIFNSVKSSVISTTLKTGGLI